MYYYKYNGFVMSDFAQKVVDLTWYIAVLICDDYTVSLVGL